MTLRIVVTSFALALAQLASAQTTIVRGRVVGDTGAPLRNAVVMQGQTIVRTDADGRFTLDVQPRAHGAATR